VNRSLRYAALAAGVTLPAFLVGGLLADPAAARAVWVGASLALLFQVGTVSVLAARLRPEHWLLGFVFGFVGRLSVVIGCAVGVGITGILPLAPTLLSLGAVLFATTVMEPIAFHAPSPLRS